MAVSNSLSDSDLSSDSSWSLLNSNPPSKQNSFENLEDPEKATEELLERQSESSKSDEGFQLSGSKSPKGNHQKSSRECINFLAIMGCLLTITGMTLLTICLPSNSVESADTEELHKNLKEVYEHAQNSSFENAVRSIESTKNAVGTVKSIDIFNSVMQNLTEETCEALILEIDNRTLSSEGFREPKTSAIPPYNDELLKIGKQLKSLSTGEQVKNFTKSVIDDAKELMKSTGLQIFVTILMQDICLVKMISEFAKRAKISDKIKEEEKKVAPNEVKKATKADRKKKIKGSTLERNEHQNILAMSAKTSAHDQLNLVPENGKSECERRFEELDSRWSVLGQNYRETMQQIKNTFQKEINEIKEKEFESFKRQQRIELARDKFIERLKAHRDAFLDSLRKLGNERKKVLHEMCHSFKQFRSWSGKDVSVGNYTIVLPDGYDFVKKLEAIKNRERNNLQVTNNEAFSYIPAKELESSPYDETTEESLLKNKNKFLERRVRSLKQNQIETGIEEAKEVVQNIATSSSKPASKCLVLKQEKAGVSSPHRVSEELPRDKAYEAVSRRKESKRQLTKLYDATFEKQSEKIKKQDLIKWGKKLQSVPVDGFRKQDPSKAHRQKIMHKELL